MKLSKKQFYILLLVIMSVSLCSCRNEADSENNKNGIATITSIKNGKVLIDSVDVESQKKQELYYKNELLKKDMLVDESSRQLYFLLKDSGGEVNDILFDYEGCNVYDLGKSRCSIIAETLNYLYIAVHNDEIVSVWSFAKEGGVFTELGEVINTEEEYFESEATCNYDSDIVYWCYSQNGKTYSVEISNEGISSRVISNESLSNVICLSGDGKNYFAMYNTKSEPYLYEPVIIKIEDGNISTEEVQLELGNIQFSFILDGNFFMAYSNKDKIEIYTTDEAGELVKKTEYDNAISVSYKLGENNVYLRMDDKIYSLEAD